MIPLKYMVNIEVVPKYKTIAGHIHINSNESRKTNT